MKTHLKPAPRVQNVRSPIDKVLEVVAVSSRLSVLPARDVEETVHLFPHAEELLLVVCE